jgi:hypothetical protein
VPTSQPARELINRTAGHLHAAAGAARALGGDDPMSVWHGLAGQLEFAAVGLAPGFQPEPGPVGWTVAEHIRDAAASLESIAPLHGPPDLPMWAWHIGELRRLAEEGDPR